MGLHPIDIALYGIDLTIMRQHAKWLSQAPLRESIGGIALVINRHRRYEPLITEIREESVNALGQEHAFINQ